MINFNLPYEFTQPVRLPLIVLVLLILLAFVGAKALFNKYWR